MIRIFRNPYYLYIFSFTLCLLVYRLNWSNLFPSLSSYILIFFLSTFLISFFLGVLLESIKPLKRKSDVNLPFNKLHLKLITILVLALYGIEFFYNKGIPFFQIIKGLDYDYRNFGIPTVHVILVTFNSFFVAYLYRIFIITKSKKVLFLIACNLLPSILIFNRGLLLMLLVTCFFIHILSIKRLKFRSTIIISIGIIVLFYLFGILGNIRINSGDDSSAYLMQISKPTSQFKESNIPEEFMWSYLYISSPLANFQHNYNNNSDLKVKSFFSFINYELLPDFISKRIGDILNLKMIKSHLIAHWLNVGTMYSDSLNYLGWIGPVAIFTFMSIFIFFYLFLYGKSDPYFIIGLALINTVVLFNTFTNMFTFSGVSFQLVYPMIFSFIKRIKL